MDNLEIAIIDSNTLTCIGLRNLLEKLLPKAIIRIFPDFAAFADDTPDMYSHYFISSQTYILYNPFFLPRKGKDNNYDARSGQSHIPGIQSYCEYFPSGKETDLRVNEVFL